MRRPAIRACRQACRRASRRHDGDRACRFPDRADAGLHRGSHAQSPIASTAPAASLFTNIVQINRPKTSIGQWYNHTNGPPWVRNKVLLILIPKFRGFNSDYEHPPINLYEKHLPPQAIAASNLVYPKSSGHPPSVVGWFTLYHRLRRRSRQVSSCHVDRLTGSQRPPPRAGIIMYMRR